jgi:alanine racemase
MDMTMIDVTDLPQTQVGDVVTLFGEGLAAERVAAFADTLGYELVCRVTPRVWREVRE